MFLHDLTRSEFIRLLLEEDSGGGGGAADDDTSFLDDDDADDDSPDVKDTAEGDDDGEPTLLKPKKEKLEKEKQPDGIRPDNIPEQFWDGDKGELRTDALLKSHSDTKKALDKMRAERKIPDSSDGYFDHIFDDAGAIKTEKALDRIGNIPKDDPLLVKFLEAAHRRNIDAGQIGIVTDFLEIANELMPEDSFDEAAERAKLGENADELIAANFNWLQSLHSRQYLRENELKALQVVGKSADAVLAIDKIRLLTGELPVPTRKALPGEHVETPEDVYAMALDERYGTDPAYTDKVDKLFEATFPQGSNINLAGLGIKSMRTTSPTRRKPTKG